MTDDAWTLLLDHFEQDLEDATASLAPWTPPSYPLPPELADRARRLLDRQRDLVRRTRAELDDVRGQLDALSRIPAARVDAPVYLDTNG